MTSGPSGRGSRRGAGPVVLGVLAGVAHLVPGYFIAVSGLVAPLWAIVLMGVAWLLLALLLFRMVERRSWWTPAIPVLAMAMWFATITAGGAYLGWEA